MKSTKETYLQLWKQLSAMEACAQQAAQGTAIDEMPLVQMFILDSLYEQDGQMASSLAKAVGRAATSFTPILDKLEKRGLILRKPHPNDRRAIRIFLTTNGRVLKRDVERVIAAVRPFPDHD